MHISQAQGFTHLFDDRSQGHSEPMGVQIIEGRAYPYWSHVYLDEVAFARAYDHFFGPQVR